MYLTGESQFIASKQGKKKNGDDWYSLKFLDEAKEDFFVAFVDEDTYQQYANIKKGTPVQLTVEMLLGSKYFDIKNIELLK